MHQIAFFFLFLIISCSALQASVNLLGYRLSIPCVDVSLIGGYRADKYKFAYEAEDPPPSFLFLKENKINGINIGFVGGRIELYNQCPLFFKSECEVGWIDSGNWVEAFTNAVGHTNCQEGSIKSGNTLDASAALGYWFDASHGIFLAPELGWGYNYQKLSHADWKYDSSWNGPWVGLVAKTVYRCYDLSAGYEYHLPIWHGKWENNCECFDSFSDVHFKTDRAYGSVFYANGGWQIFSCLYAGLEFKYQYWKAHHSKKKDSSFDSCALTELNYNVWQAGSISGELRYAF